MSDLIFAAAQRPSMVNRHAELETIEKAIFLPGSETRLVAIKGTGGIGKTHLLCEVLRRMGRPEPHYPAGTATESWAATNHTLVSDLLDLADLNLHTFDQFILALRNAFVWHRSANFSRFDRAEAHIRRKIYESAEYRVIEQARQEAEQAFFDDCNAIAKEGRLVWVLDTAERLNFMGAGWLLEQDLLTPQDVGFSTLQRLLELLAEGKLPNTTILLAGRYQEAKITFDTLQDEKNGAGSRYDYIDITLGNFSQEDTRTYLVELARHWQQQQPDSPIAAYLQDRLAKVADWPDVLWLYTGGQPVRLALFADILAEGKKEPTPLQETFANAQRHLGWQVEKYGPLDKTTLAELLNKDQSKKNEAYQKIASKLEAAQFEIEGEFIDLIFARGGELRAQILKILAQVRRGLDERHLHFILDALPGTNITAWKEDPGRLEEIKTELDSMYYLSFVKKTPEGYTLQDELYHIYDRHAIADETTRQAEAASRRFLYRRLLILVNHEIENLKKQKAGYLKEDERKLRWEPPSRALVMSFAFVSEVEVNARIDLSERLLQAQIENLYYELRIEPYHALNDTFYDLAEERRLTNIEGDAQLFNELWRVLTDEFARYFIQLSPLEETTEQAELWTNLERAAHQEEIAHWIKRFAFTNQNQRVVEFADQIEAYVKLLPRDGRGTLGWTLNHTFSRGERTCWREFARIGLGQDLPDAIRRLEEAASELERLLTPKGIPEREERSFLKHPAKIRLRRVIGAVYNGIGLGYTYQGQFRQAIKAYAEALRYFREPGLVGQRTVTLNNLSRALSEAGRRTRAIRICRDGLDLRRELGHEAFIAYSYNTLALIYNDNLQPNDAWPEATKAVVYFRRLADLRGLGLSLLQLGEALRRLALARSPLVGSPEELLNVAESATLEALDIFTNAPEVNLQIIRRVEAEIELGCLYRDYLYYVKNFLDVHPEQETRWRLLKDKALQHLEEAVKLAENRFPFHHLDAQVDLAWTHYYADDLDQAEAFSDDIISSLSGKPFVLKKNNLPPSPQAIDETYALFQLGKLWTVKGRIALDHFLDCGRDIQKIKQSKTEAHQVSGRDRQSNQYLQAAAEAFVLSLGYGLLFSPRSPNIGFAFDHLYEYLKKFNPDEMKLFYRHQHKVRRSYQVTKIKPENLADVEEFLLESFGDYLSEDAKEKR
ncbi:MAG: hypothetical protein BroJett011_70730 [Chloroflexota bacterium]|nr:MAG: hypothetical protein BroJett011_70730 [Chloroflexota bacterium]